MANERWYTKWGGRKFLAFCGALILLEANLITGLIAEKTFIVGFISALGIYGGSNVGAAVAYIRGKLGAKT